MHKSILTSAALLAVAIPSTSHAGLFGTNPGQNSQAAIMNGEMGGMVVAFRDNQCNNAILKFKSLQTGRSHTARMNVFSFNTIKQLTVMTVPAGQYRLVSASCQEANKVYRYKDIASGYGPITVMPGEVVYPGTFNPQRRGRRLTGYNLLNETGAKAQAVSLKYPPLASRFTPRPIQVIRPASRRLYSNLR